MTRALDRWLFEEYRCDVAGLALFRIGFAAYVLLFLLPVGRWLEAVPQAFFNPPLGPAALFTGFPPYWVIRALNLLVGAGAGALLVGWHSRLASVAVGVGLLALNSWCYALGKINHDILIVFLPLLFSPSGWGNAVSLDARGGSKRDAVDAAWVTALFALLIGSAMFLAGVSKLEAGWWRPGAWCTYRHLWQNHQRLDREALLTAPMLSLHSGLVWKTLDYATLILEIGFLPCVLRRRAFRAACATACVFHLLVWLTFDIVFAINLVAYAAFFPLPRPRAIRRLGEAIGRLPPVAVLLSALAVGGAAGTGHSLIGGFGRPLSIAILVLGAIAAAIFLLREIARGIRRSMTAELTAGRIDAA